MDAQVAPWIEQRGNLRLSIACGDVWASTPEDGLDVQVDGTSIDADRVTGRSAAYLIAPGHHRVQLSAPGCEPSTFDFDADAIHSTHADGRLVLDDWWRGGTAGSPNGFGITVGAWLQPAPGGAAGDSVFDQSETYDSGHTAGGAYLSFSRERRFFLTATDITVAGGSTSGVVSGDRTAQQFTASVFDNRYQFRVGGRLPLHFASLAAGTGIGVEWWITSGQFTSPNNTSGLFAPDGPDASFYLPMWASATVKATCEWGVQALAQYDVHPSSMDTNGFSFGAGVIYQPSASCSEAPGVRVTASENTAL
ncbi:MAG TPA: hypothetical protein VGH63_05080 [Polyangia bacterium]|jgi:hypothetical protein